MNLPEFALLLRTRRSELGFSKAAAARRYGHDPAAIAFYEDGVSRPSLAHVDKLAAAYQLPPNRLRELLDYPVIPETEPTQLARIVELEQQLDRVRGELDKAVTLLQALRQQSAREAA